MWATGYYDTPTDASHWRLPLSPSAAASHCRAGSNCGGHGPSCRGNGTDGWDQQLLAGGNGEGTLFYPGRPDKIGGTEHIPVSSLRLTMIREGNEDYEYLVQAAAKVGRDKVVAAMARVMRSATQFTSDAADILATRKTLAAMIAGASSGSVRVGTAPAGRSAAD